MPHEQELDEQLLERDDKLELLLELEWLEDEAELE
jgi:hypothetical protein